MFWYGVIVGFCIGMCLGFQAGVAVAHAVALHVALIALDFVSEPGETSAWCTSVKDLRKTILQARDNAKPPTKMKEDKASE